MKSKSELETKLNEIRERIEKLTKENESAKAHIERNLGSIRVLEDWTDELTEEIRKSEETSKNPREPLSPKARFPSYGNPPWNDASVKQGTSCHENPVFKDPVLKPDGQGGLIPMPGK